MTARFKSVFADTKQISDAALIRRISNADEIALELLYDRYRTILFGLLFRILNNRSEAENILQEVFVQIWQQGRSLEKERGKPFTWLATITRSKAIDRLRFLKTQNLLAPEGKANPPIFLDSKIEQNLTFWKRQVLVRTALSELPENQRRLLLMAFFEGCSQREIAERENLTLETVRTLMQTGMTKFRETLDANIGDWLYASVID